MTQRDMSAAPPFITSANAMMGPKNPLDWMRPSPPRTGCRVEPLIESAAAYPAMETLVLEATQRVWLSFRVFDPATKARSDLAMSLGLEDWAAILLHVARAGVEVRIILADFEPVLADYLHAGSWSSFLAIRDVLDQLEKHERGRIQLIVIQHEGEIGWGWRQFLRLLLRRRIRRVVDKLILKARHDDGGLDTRPGLWRHVEWKEKKAHRWKPAPPPRLWPATYHQKFIVVDGKTTVIGGLDLDERRWDDRRHRQRADQTWHDITARIEGPVVKDAERHFAFLWNREMPRYRSTVAEWTDGCGREMMLDPLSSTDVLPNEIEAAGAAEVQLVRTLSRKGNGLFALGPAKAVRELKAAHRTVMRSARKCLYIEAQFFRSKKAADWVEHALRASPDLEVIILVANTPEEIAFEGQTENLAHRHGEHLQARALGRLLRKAGPDRIGLFSLAKHEKAKGKEKDFARDRGTAYGSGLIHIHSKLLIADDRACLVSSANINGRSFEWDTELGFLWVEEGDAIRDFRRDLWGQLFGEHLPADASLDWWRETARHNARVAPEERRGFVVPYQLGRARRFARPYWFIPDDLV